MGTWALPQTKKQAEKLSKLLEKPLKAKSAEDELYDLIGDDIFFDEIAEIRRKKGASYDVRSIIKPYIEDLIKMHNENPNNFYKPFEPEALEILKACLK